MEIPSNSANKQNAVETSVNTQVLQVIIRMPPTSASGGSTPTASAPMLPPPRVVGPIVSPAIREQVAVLARARVATSSDIDAPEEEAEVDIPIPIPPADRRQGAPPSTPQEVPSQWLARFECLQKGLQDVQYQIRGAPDGESQSVPFTEEIMADEHINIALLHRYTAGVKCRVLVNTFTRLAQQWFNQLPSGSIRSFGEFRSLFLHHFACSKRRQKTIMSLFSLQQREGQSLKEYLQRFNLAALEVPTATSNALICAFM
ncbi:UNVERIFIED_CONTAM: hypothetical protein Sradi_4024900 [Sesamum radiatum]|uniref:Retrotransposon gag domain-containing protein n=1 Tax=Sesamum radiatum TaxID=300843 RepID=A0AAW2PKS0_SESRA